MVHIRSSLIAISAVLGTFTTPALAQTEAQPSEEKADQGTGDIVVTAQRREQRLADVPVSVSVVSGEKLAQTGLSNLQDVAARLPGLKVGHGPGASVISLRGVSSGNNPGFEQPVGTFIDGVYRGRGRSTAAALFDVERIEVLKGPQSTFFGHNVVGGALNIATKRPVLGDTAVNLSALYSPSDGQYIGEAGVNAPLGDKLAIRIAAKLYGSNGYSKNLFDNRKLPRNRDFVGRASLLFKPNDVFTSNLRFDYGRNRDKGPAAEAVNCPVQAPYPATVISGAGFNTCGRALFAANAAGTTFNTVVDGIGYQADPGFNYDFKEIAWTNEIDFGKATLSGITSYSDHRPETFTAFLPPILAGTSSSLYISNYEKTKQFSQEVRLTSNNGGSFEYMVGGYYARENLDNDFYGGNWFAPIGGTPGAAPYTAATPVVQFVRMLQEADVYSAFGSLSFKPTEALSLDLGLRYSSVHKSVDRTNRYGTVDPSKGARLTRDSFVLGPSSVQTALGAFQAFGDKRTDSKLMPSAKLSYKPSEDIMLYASWARGFKAGGFANTTLVTFEPETVDSYELGFKASLFDRRLFVTATAFRGDYTNLQEAVVIINPVTLLSVNTVANAGKSRSKGVEFTADAKLSDHVRLRTDLTYLDSKYIDFPNAPCVTLDNYLASAAGRAANGGVNIGRCIGGQQSLNGVRRNFAAKWTGNVGLSFSYPLGNSLNVTFDPQVYFTSKYRSAFNAGDDLYLDPGYTKFDARLGVGAEDGRWEVAVIGKNLTNKRTWSFSSSNPGSTGSKQLYTDPERSVAFQVTTKF